MNFRYASTIFVFLLSLTTYSFAEDELNIAVLNYQALLFESVAAEDATEVLRGSVGAVQARLQEIQAGMDTRQNRLRTDAAILTEEETARFRLELQEMNNERAVLTAQLQQAQQQSRDEFVRQYQPFLRQLVEAYILEQGYNLVVDSQAIVWNTGATDITQDLLTLFNDAYVEQRDNAELSTNN